MHNHRNTLKTKLAQWLYGRYGSDALSSAIHVVVLVCLVLSFIPFLSGLSIFGAGLLVLDIFRTLSRNIPARRRELQMYMNIRKKCSDRWDLVKRMWRERKTHCYFRCTNCKAMLRVPKHRGEIVVTCPKCKTKTDKKT